VPVAFLVGKFQPSHHCFTRSLIWRSECTSLMFLIAGLYSGVLYVSRSSTGARISTAIRAFGCQIGFPVDSGCPFAITRELTGHTRSCYCRVEYSLDGNCVRVGVQVLVLVCTGVSILHCSCPGDRFINHVNRNVNSPVTVSSSL
jgi:hypothetical protein